MVTRLASQLRIAANAGSDQEKRGVAQNLFAMLDHADKVIGNRRGDEAANAALAIFFERRARAISGIGQNIAKENTHGQRAKLVFAAMPAAVAR